MRRMLIAAAGLALAAPAGAQEIFTPEMDRDIARAIPPAEQFEAMGMVLDRVLGAFLDIPIGPIVDAVEAADPDARGARRYERRDRTLREMAERDDPDFEARMRDQVRAVSSNMGTVMQQVAILAPIMRQQLGEAERNVAEAIRQGRERAMERRERR